MRLSIISVLLVFISAICAIPLGGIASNKDIQPISKRTEPDPAVIIMQELFKKVGDRERDYSTLEKFWDPNRLGDQIAGMEHVDPVYKLRELYNGEPAIIKAIISNDITDEMVINKVVYLGKARMKLRAFAKNFSPSTGSPRYLMIIADVGYRSTFRPSDLPHGVTSNEVSELRESAEKELDKWNLAFPTQHNDLLKPMKDKRKPWKIVFI